MLPASIIRERYFARPASDNTGEIGSAISAVEDEYLGSQIFQSGAPIFGGRRGCHNQQVAVGATDHLRLKRQTELRVHNDTQQGPASRLPGSIGEKAVVGENGADSGQNRIRAVPKVCTCDRATSLVIHP